MTGPIIVFVLHNLLLFYIWSKSRKRDDIIRRKNFRALLVVYLLLALLGLQSGDYETYARHISDISTSIRNVQGVSDYIGYFHMEPVYLYLAVLLNGNYFIWRLLVFGISFVFLFSFANKINADSWEYFLWFTLVDFSGFIVGRMYWGVALFFCSFAYFIKTGKLKYCLFALLGVFAHKCLYVLPIFLPLGFVKLNKKSLIIMGIAFIAMVFVISYFMQNFGLLDIYSEGLSDNIEFYTESESDKSVFGNSIGEKIIYLTRSVAMFLLLFYIVVKTLLRKIVLPKEINSMLVFSVSIMLLAAAFSYVKIDSGIFAWRYITVGWFPLTFVVYYFSKYHLIEPIVLNSVKLLLFLSFEASLTVPIFYASING